MQKTLIIQVEVGNTPGYVYRATESPKAAAAIEPINELLIPSVKKYCKKHNYDYKKITEYPKDLDITYFNKNTKDKNYDYSKGGKNKCSTLIRYLAMGDNNYERIVILDNDIWIPPWAEKLPEVFGHHGVVDLGKDYSGFVNQFSLPFGKFINGGVQMVSKEAGKSLKKYIIEAIQRKAEPPGRLHTDQAYMNHWRSQHIIHAYTLSYKWNYMVGCHGGKDYQKANFIHYAGWDGRGILMEDIDYIRGQTNTEKYRGISG